MIDQHTIEKLEFPKIIKLIAGKCVTPYGPEQVYQFVPMFDKARIDQRQTEISQMKDIINFGVAFPLSRMEDCREILTKAQVEAIAKIKLPDLNASSLEMAMRTVEGTARSMGVLVEG